MSGIRQLNYSDIVSGWKILGLFRGGSVRVHDIFDEGGFLALLHGEVGGEGLGAVQLRHGQVHPRVLADAEPRGAAVLLPRPLPRPLQPPLPAPGPQIPAAVLAPPVLRAAGLGV